mmetsp:Transcript_576/g.1340  ORF Transcript_576/g.1340 Transcript_576/m.1340 type:complete len:356 (+) Transcript_576:103-1170(+)
MSEGGKYAWKRQSTRSFARAPDYKRLLKPLPDPPGGCEWIHDESSAEKWILVADTNVPAVPVVEAPPAVVDVVPPPVHANGNDVNETTTTTARMIPLETDCLWNKGEQPKPMASVVTDLTNGEQQISTDMLQDEEDGVAILPQARMVPTAAAVSMGVAANKPTDDGDDKQKKSELVGVEYTEHVVLPTDTLAGICLLYKITRRELQRANRFYGNDLRLAPGKLYVPITEKARRLGWKAQDVESHEFKMAAFLAQHRSLSMMEAKCYLDTNDWDLEQAIEEARHDVEWERQEAERLRRFEAEQACLAAEAATTTGKNHSSMQTRGLNSSNHEDDDDECLGCLKFWLPLRRTPKLLN